MLITQGGIEESKQKEEPFKIDRIIHDNSFKYLLTPEEYLSKRVDFILEYLWKEPELWNNIQDHFAKVVLLVGNKSFPIFETLLGVVEQRILSSAQEDFQAKAYYYFGEEQRRVFQWNNLEESAVSGERGSLKKVVLQEIDKFYEQDDSKLFELEIQLKVDDIFIKAG